MSKLTCNNSEYFVDIAPKDFQVQTSIFISKLTKNTDMSDILSNTKTK